MQNEKYLKNSTEKFVLGIINRRRITVSGIAFPNIFTYSETNTPAMPLPIGYAHFGGFFHARRARA